MVTFDPVQRFTNLDEVGVWLEDTSAYHADLVTARAALRAVPALIVDDQNALVSRGLLIFRMALFLAVRAISPKRGFIGEFSTSWIKRASEHAIFHSPETDVCRTFAVAVASFGSRALPDSRSGLQISTLQNSCIAIGYARRDGTEIFITDQTSAFKQYEIDSSRFETDEAKILNPLWDSDILPDSLQQEWEALQILLSRIPEFRFWRRFYEGMWNGTFDEWDLALAVIQIPEAEWEKGHEHIGEVIAEIEADLILKKLPQVEDIYETEDGLYDVKSAFTEPAALIDSIASRVQFAFDLAVTSNSCDLDELSTAAKLLRHALDCCLDDPNALEQFLRQASTLIADGLARGDFSHHDTLDVLIATLNEVGLQLRADHPDVAAAVASRAEQAVKELSDAKRLEGAELIEDLRDEGTTGRLNTEMGLAAETARDGTSAKATASALKRVGNQAGKISLAERAKKAEGSGTMASIKIALRAEKVIGYVLSLLGGGG